MWIGWSQWVNLSTRSGTAVLLELYFPCSPLNTSTPLWPHLRIPIIVKSHSLTMTPRKMTAEAIGVTCWTSYWSNLAMKTLGGGKETRPLGLCPGQREHAQHRVAFRAILLVLILPAWQDTMACVTSCPPRQTRFLLAARLSIPAYIASLGFTCSTLDTWKLDAYVQAGRPSLSSRCKAKSRWQSLWQTSKPGQTVWRNLFFCIDCVGIVA